MLRSRSSKARLAACGDGVARSGHPSNDVAANRKMRRVPSTAEGTGGGEREVQTSVSSVGTGTEVDEVDITRLVEALMDLDVEGVFRTVVGFL